MLNTNAYCVRPLRSCNDDVTRWSLWSREKTWNWRNERRQKRRKGRDHALEHPRYDSMKCSLGLWPNGQSYSKSVLLVHILVSTLWSEVCSVCPVLQYSIWSITCICNTSKYCSIKADLEQLRRIAINQTKRRKLHRTIQEKLCTRS